MKTTTTTTTTTTTSNTTPAMDTSRVKKFLKDMEDDRIRNDYIAVVDAHVTGLLDSVRGGREKKRKGKCSASSQIAETREKIDITTPDSIFVNTNLKDIINKATFNSLPLFYQYKLVQMLPKCDQITTSEGWTKMSSTALRNEFFNRAVKSWSDRLKDGKLTPEFLVRWRNEILKESSKLDPWKAKHFERVWGEALESQKEIDNELDRIPKSSVYGNNGQQSEFSRSSSSCSSNIDDEPSSFSVHANRTKLSSTDISLNNQINCSLSSNNSATSNQEESRIEVNDDSKQQPVLKSILKKPKSSNKNYYDKNLYGINDSLEEENNVITEEATVPSISETSDISIEGVPAPAPAPDKRVEMVNSISEPITALNNSGLVTITPIDASSMVKNKPQSPKESNIDLSNSLDVPVKKVRIMEEKEESNEISSKIPKVQSVVVPSVKGKSANNPSECSTKPSSSNHTNNSKKKPLKKRSTLLDSSLDAAMEEELPFPPYPMTQSAAGRLFLLANHSRLQNIPPDHTISEDDKRQDLSRFYLHDASVPSGLSITIQPNKTQLPIETPPGLTITSVSINCDVSTPSTPSPKSSSTMSPKEPINNNTKNNSKANQMTKEDNSGSLQSLVQNDNTLSLTTRRKLEKLSSSITLEPISGDDKKSSSVVIPSNIEPTSHKGVTIENIDSNATSTSPSTTNNVYIDSNGLKLPFKIPDSITIIPCTDNSNNMSNNSNEASVVTPSHQTVNPGSSSQRQILFLSNCLNTNRRISDEISNKKDYSVDFNNQIPGYCSDLPKLPPHITVIPLGPGPVNSSNVFTNSVPTSNSTVKVNNFTNNNSNNNNHIIVNSSNSYTITTNAVNTAVNSVNQTYGIQSNFTPSLTQGVTTINLASIAANQGSANRNNCDCNLKALVICSKCGAFCHNDCIGPIQLCITCLVR
ncbi:polycomb protein Asx [Tetranychus urticae]|nr:polycomb protein Asx [Tetranychus urticae]